jgi:hypothetical protein
MISERTVMTTLIAQRPRHRVGRAVPTETTAPRAASEPDLIRWTMPADGVWTGRFDLLDAGTIRRTAGGYAVESWDGAPEGVFPTLAAAQLSLEPAHRAWLRERAETRRSSRRHAIGAVGGIAAVVAAAATGVLTTFPL